jgi:hypothetical protein
MTVSVQTPFNSSTGNGITTVFPYSFKILSADDLKVTVNGVLQTISTDYTVSGIGGNGGNVTFVVAPANGAIVVRYSDTLMKRDTDYQENGDFRESVVDADFDRLWLGLRDTTSKADRGLRAPPGETFADLPAAATRVSRLLGFDGLGMPTLYSQATLGTIVPTAYIATLLDDADAPAARLTLGAPAAANGTHTGTTTISTAVLGTTGNQTTITATTDARTSSTSQFPQAQYINTTADANSGVIQYLKNRAAGTTQSGDALWTLQFYGYANAAQRISAQMAAVQDAAASGSTVPSSIVWSTQAAGGSLQENLRIDSTGCIRVAGEAAATGYTARGDVTLPPARAVRAKNTLKAWVNFDGTAASPITPRDHFNVASVTKHAAGDYTCNLTAGIFADANYSAVGTAGSTTLAGFYTFRGPVQQTPTATAYRCRVSDAVPNYLDVNHICVQFAGA